MICTSCAMKESKCAKDILKCANEKRQSVMGISWWLLSQRHNHGRELRDFITTTMVDTFFDISANTRQILAVFKAGYPEKMIATCPSYAIRLKRYSEEQQKKFVARADLRKSRNMDWLLSFFRGICFKPHANLISIYGNIKKSYQNRGIFTSIRHF